MTIEIRELIVRVEVTEPPPQVPVLSGTGNPAWDEQRLLEKLKREVLEYLQERGSL